jgi:RimJ/RimL family protein N-acetyltransferase
MIVPFEQEWGKLIYQAQFNPSYKNFFRDFPKGLSMEECTNFPKRLGCYVYGFYEEEKIKAVLTLWIMPFQVGKIGLFILEDYQNIGASKRMSEESDLMMRSMGIRKVFTEVLSDDLRAIKAAENSGFVKCGVLSDQVILDGEYKSLTLMEKHYG